LSFADSILGRLAINIHKSFLLNNYKLYGGAGLNVIF